MIKKRTLIFLAIIIVDKRQFLSHCGMITSDKQSILSAVTRIYSEERPANRDKEMVKERTAHFKKKTTTTFSLQQQVEKRELENRD